MKGRVYLDNAATTRVSEDVLQEMMPYFRETYANPSAVYSSAGEAKKAVKAARERAAALIGAKPNEICFTAGGTESDNWAIRAVAEGLRDRGRHIITDKIEHHAVLHTCRYLEKKGYEVTYLDVDEKGMISPESLEKAIRPDTILISVMAANNEIGTLEPIAKIGEIAAERRILFHTDAVQAYGHVPLNTEEMHIDLLSASGHKLNGPKGTGILYCRENVRLSPLLYGGAQEKGRRAGTLNVPGIVGFGKAAALANENMPERIIGETQLRDYLIDRVLAEIPDSRLNGHRQNRLPGNAHFCFGGIEGETLLLLLDQKGICASGGAACTSEEADASHVLLAVGLSREIARGSLRLTLSADNTREELDRTVEAIKEIVGRLRDMRQEER